MRTLMLLIFLSAVAATWASPIDPQRQLINRPNEEKLLRNKRDYNSYSKDGVKQLDLAPYGREGGAPCDGPVCELKPSDIPSHCDDGFCEFPNPFQ